MRPKSSKFLYLLLVAWALISMSYYVAGAEGLRAKWFQGDKHARFPFDTKADGQTLVRVEKEGKDAGLSDGDVLKSLDGAPFTGAAQINRLTKLAKPGELLNVGVRSPEGGVKQVSVRLHRTEGPSWSLGGLIYYLGLILGIPLLGLIVGYWVVAARPQDLNAWLVLMILCFTETAFGDLDWSFHTGILFVVFGLWHVVVQSFVPLALLWFGIYFPERWRMDKRAPWLKWLFLAVAVVVFAGTLVILSALSFDVARMRPLMIFDQWLERVDGSLYIACIVLFLAALFDKLRTVSTPDARRRLRVLAIGSALSLGPPS